ncbi:1960_t:CDS:2, partial [Entrophospora sp. SA101]
YTVIEDKKRSEQLIAREATESIIQEGIVVIENVYLNISNKAEKVKLMFEE